jgi:hypothetical protein
MQSSSVFRTGFYLARRQAVIPQSKSYQLPDGGQLVFWKDGRHLRHGRVLEHLGDSVLVRYTATTGVIVSVADLEHVSQFFTRSSNDTCAIDNN